jgi:hypothetical protein
MSEPSFEELQRLWQTPPSAIAPAQRIIFSQHRRRWLSRLYFVFEIVCTLIGAPYSIWIALQPGGLALGLGALIIVLFAAGASLWARSVRVVRVEDALFASLDEGVRRARISVRLAYATLWGAIAAMVFIAAIAFAWWSASDLSVAAARRMILALGIWIIWIGFLLAVTIFYLSARARELAQLELVREALKGRDQ